MSEPATPGRPVDSAVHASAKAPTNAMPDYPPVRSGQLAVRSNGPHTINGTWKAEATRCERIPMLTLTGGQPGIGTLLIVQLPEQQPLVGSYRIKPAPAPLVAPGARMGVQMYRIIGALALQALDGVVDITELGRTVSGRFAVTLRVITADTLVHYAGSFKEVPVRQVPDQSCAPPDSTKRSR